MNCMSLNQDTEQLKEIVIQQVISMSGLSGRSWLRLHTSMPNVMSMVCAISVFVVGCLRSKMIVIHTSMKMPR